MRRGGMIGDNRHDWFLADIRAIPHRGGGHESRSVFPSPDCQGARGDTPPILGCAMFGGIVPNDCDFVMLSMVNGDTRPSALRDTLGTHGATHSGGSRRQRPRAQPPER